MEHPTADQLAAGLDAVRASPADDGVVELIVRRPDVDVREAVERAVLDPQDGLVGDTWRRRGDPRTPDGSANPDAQLTLVNDRLARLVAGDPSRRALAGDQLYVDLDLSAANLPAGTRLALGSAVVEITGLPHTGCAKFAHRFGNAAARLVNSPAGRALNLRGVNAKVVVAGTVGVGDAVRKVPPRFS